MLKKLINNSEIIILLISVLLFLYLISDMFAIYKEHKENDRLNNSLIIDTTEYKFK